jgi:DNA-directed RNA polymerase II subunit RPB1
LSVILPNVNLKSKAINGPPKGPDGRSMPNDFNAYDHLVTIQEGELLEGTIDKKTIGSSMGGLIHTACLDAGHENCQIHEPSTTAHQPLGPTDLLQYWSF